MNTDTDNTTNTTDNTNNTTNNTDNTDTDNTIKILNNFTTQCTHQIHNQTQISGDLICTACGQVLQSNSNLASEPAFLDRPHSHSQSQFHSVANLVPALSYQQRSELSLRTLANQLIDTYALKPSYSIEAINLIHQYWQHCNSKFKYGHTGNRLLVAVLFLLARRDRLAINLSLLSASINSSPQDCGVFFETLTTLNPALKALATSEDFTEKTLDCLLKELESNFNICILDSQIHFHSLQMKTGALANLIQDTEKGSSTSAESTALAATWIALYSLGIPKLPLESAVSNICVSATLSQKTVRSKHSQIIQKLTERAKELLPTTFATIQNQNKTKKLALLLDNLSLLIGA